MSTLQSVDAVENFRRVALYPADDPREQGFRSALDRHRELTRVPDKEVTVKTLSRTTPLPSQDRYPFCQPPFLYPRRGLPQKHTASASQHRYELLNSSNSKRAIEGGSRPSPATTVADKVKQSADDRHHEPVSTISPLAAAVLGRAAKEASGSSTPTHTPPPPGITEQGAGGAATGEQVAKPASPPLPVSIGMSFMLEAEAKKEAFQNRSQAERGSPLSWPDMPAPLVRSPEPPSMHHRRYYYDASLWNPFRAPRLEDEFGGIEFYHREPSMPTSLGYLACHPVRPSSYVPVNTAAPHVTKLNRMLHHLTAPERRIAEEEQAMKAVRDKASQRAPGSVIDPRSAIERLMAHREEDEVTRKVTHGCSSNGFPLTSSDVALLRIHEHHQRRDELIRCGYMAPREEVTEEAEAAKGATQQQQPSASPQQTREEARGEPTATASGSKQGGEQSGWRVPPYVEERWTSTYPFQTSAEVKLERLKAQRAAQDQHLFDGCPRKSRRQYALPPMLS